MDSSLIDKKIGSTVGVDDDGQFKPEQVAEEFVFKTVKKDEDKNNDDDDDDNDDDADDNDSTKDDEKRHYYDDKEAPVEEEEDKDEMGDDNNDEKIDDKTINEEDDDDKAKQEKWYYKEKFILDWVNKFSRTHCVRPGFAISIDEMMKLFKGCSNTTHRMKKKLIKEGFKFIQW